VRLISGNCGFITRAGSAGDNDKMIPAILLAAGKSERMGRLKQLIEFGGKSFVRHSVDNLVGSGIEQVIVVTGHQQHAVREALSSCPVRIVHNPRYQTGMSTSIKAGIDALPSGCDAFLVALADQPLVDSATISKLVAEYTRRRPLVLVPTFSGRKGHPIIISTELTAEILAMDDEIGLKQILDRHKSSILPLAVDTDSVLVDFDYPGDLKRLAIEPD
jgi:molybdenum cofactor cytidylyltransferase